MPRTERSPLRVLVLSADYVPGAWSGIGTAVATQAAALARRGVAVDVLLPADHPAIRNRCQAPHTSRTRTEGVRCLTPVETRWLRCGPYFFRSE